ncbi:hypothetical protein O9G_002800 [Rozella allomycis CSF55]|uniref:Uncharacterized protein n=1 Tax=Rozella allomycis (strain CSF55) TaxID=988480 RepID=A0A075AMQ2_ROZAC|nr:hypothetical protein O9G_002800 [Rozella allomycis CSF55]|eukprot:EPZ30923.1 hypothetical protein O9G_002800 [Rozella allomycis CSF55]
MHTEPEHDAYHDQFTESQGKVKKASGFYKYVGKPVMKVAKPMFNTLFVVLIFITIMSDQYDDWLSYALEQSAAEITADSVVDDIIKRTQNVIFEKHIESQVLPYAVDFSKDAILSLIRFKEWSPDEEPENCVCDSWARGVVSVQKKNTDQDNHKASESPIEVTLAKQVPETSIQTKPLVKEATDFGLGSTKSTSRRQSGNIIEAKDEPETEKVKKLTLLPPIDNKRTKQKTMQERILTKEMENIRMFQKMRKLEKEGSVTDYTYDQEGKLVFIRKPSKSKFVTQNIRTRVVDHADEINPVPWMSPNLKESKPLQVSSKDSTSQIQISNKSGNNDIHNGPPAFVQDSYLDSPNTIDVIKISNGVVYKEGEIDLGTFSNNFGVSPGSSSYKSFVKSGKPDEAIDEVLNKTNPIVKRETINLKTVL